MLAAADRNTSAFRAPHSPPIPPPPPHDTLLDLPRANTASGSALPPVEVWGVGTSLDGWVQTLSALDVRARKVEHKPGAPMPKPPKGGHASGERPARLFAYGMPKARAKILNTAKDFDTNWDIFVGS